MAPAAASDGIVVERQKYNVPELDDATRQERRKKAGDYLKMADKLFKGSDYEGAARLVQAAIETDPHNPYAIAYQERIRFAIEQRDAKKS